VKAPLFLAALLLAASGPVALFAATPRLSPGKSLTLIDATGKKVGGVVGTRSGGGTDTDIVGVDVALILGSLDFVLRASRTALTGNATLTLIFQSGDCSGPAFLLDDDGDVADSPLAPVVVDHTNTAYVGLRNERFRTSAMASFRYPTGPGCNPFGLELRFVVPTTQINLNVFIPPFSVR
jgi:hypothetical protein